MKRLTFLGVFLTFLSVVGCSGLNESFPVVPDLMKILKSDYRLNVSETCEAHLNDYLMGIQTGQPWALQMVDSMPKVPDGVLTGHFVQLGHFDECVNAVNEKFSGKHCMASLDFKKEEEKSLQLSNFQMGLDKSSGDVPGMGFRFGLCVPSTCSAEDLKNAIQSLEELNFLKVNVAENDCSTKDFRPFRTEDWVTVGIVGFMVFIALGSTVYDMYERYQRKNETPNKLWTSFSFYTNGKNLFSISQSSSQLKCLHGIRFLSMGWVILAHSYYSFVLGAPVNIVDMFRFLKEKSFMPVSNGFVSVDSFFFLSGLLVCLVFFRDIAKKKTFDVPVAFIHRYLRLTPPFALLILIQATIISRIGNGPLWSTLDFTENSCRESWWTGILYIQNYMKPEAMCLGQAWYLSADMQMFWVSPLILYPLLWFPSFAPVFLLLTVLAAAFTNFAIAFVNNLKPNIFIGNINMDVLGTNQFKVEYVTFHTRMAPWLIGVATGYIICGVQAKKIRMNLSKKMVMIGWVAALSLLGGSLFGISRFISDTEYTKAEAAFYLAFHRVGWALGMSWVVVACVCGYGGPVNDFLSSDFFQPLAKLSYCNFLVHMTLQYYRVFSTRINLYIRHIDIVYSYVGDLVISNLISIPVVLLFELPFMNLDRYFLQKLVIFPLPKSKNEEKKPVIEEKPEETIQDTKDVEKGEVNNGFSKSES